MKSGLIIALKFGIKLKAERLGKDFLYQKQVWDEIENEKIVCFEHVSMEHAVRTCKYLKKELPILNSRDTRREISK